MSFGAARGAGSGFGRDRDPIDVSRLSRHPRHSTSVPSHAFFVKNDNDVTADACYDDNKPDRGNHYHPTRLASSSSFLKGCVVYLHEYDDEHKNAVLLIRLASLFPGCAAWEPDSEEVRYLSVRVNKNHALRSADCASKYGRRNVSVGPLRLVSRDANEDATDNAFVGVGDKNTVVTVLSPVPHPVHYEPAFTSFFDCCEHVPGSLSGRCVNVRGAVTVLLRRRETVGHAASSSFPSIRFSLRDGSGMGAKITCSRDAHRCIAALRDASCNYADSGTDRCGPVVSSGKTVSLYDVVVHYVSFDDDIDAFDEDARSPLCVHLHASRRSGAEVHCTAEYEKRRGAPVQHQHATCSLYHLLHEEDAFHVLKRALHVNTETSLWTNCARHTDVQTIQTIQTNHTRRGEEEGADVAPAVSTIMTHVTAFFLLDVHDGEGGAERALQTRGARPLTKRLCSTFDDVSGNVVFVWDRPSAASVLDAVTVEDPKNGVTRRADEERHSADLFEKVLQVEHDLCEHPMIVQVTAPQPSSSFGGGPDGLASSTNVPSPSSAGLVSFVRRAFVCPRLAKLPPVSEENDVDVSDVSNMSTRNQEEIGSDSERPFPPAEKKKRLELIE